jgi:hypothetical protein
MIGAAVVALGIVVSAIQFGWQPLSDGGQEYIVQVEPELTAIDAFRKEGFSSDVPPQLRDIRRIRVLVGSEPLPHQGEMAPPAALGNTTGPAARIAPNPTLHENPPEKLPAGVSATPLKAAPTADPFFSPGVTLADGHQPADPTAKNGETAGATPAATSKSRSPSSKLASGESPFPASAPPPRPWLALVLTAAGLIVSLSANVFLGWIHRDTRSRYRELVAQLRSQRGAATN